MAADCDSPPHVINPEIYKVGTFPDGRQDVDTEARENATPDCAAKRQNLLFMSSAAKSL